jgi:hypothetical protein
MRINHFFVYVSTSLVDLDFHIFEVSKSHSDTPHSVGLLWTSEQPIAKICIPDNTNNTRKRQTSMPTTEYEPAIPGN